MCKAKKQIEKLVTLRRISHNTFPTRLKQDARVSMEFNTNAYFVFHSFFFFLFGSDEIINYISGKSQPDHSIKEMAL